MMPKRIEAKCPKCGGKIVRMFKYDDKYAGKSKWGTKGYLVGCSKCYKTFVIEKGTGKIFTPEEWWGELE